MRFILYFPALLLVGCISSKQPVVYHPLGASGRVLEIGFGGAFDGAEGYAADGLHVCHEQYRRKEERTFAHNVLDKQIEVTPSPAAWARFWRIVDDLHLKSWKAEYPSEVWDGLSWSVTLTTREGTMKSRGQAAYPVVGHPKQTTLNSEAFDKLIRAFVELQNSR